MGQSVCIVWIQNADGECSFNDPQSHRRPQPPEQERDLRNPRDLRDSQNDVQDAGLTVYMRNTVLVVTAVWMEARDTRGRPSTTSAK